MVKICIDAGHVEGYKTYNIKPEKYEGTQMYYLSLYEKEELEKYKDVEVVLTRERPGDNPSLWNRGKMAKDFDLFISNHSNANSSEAVNGVLCYMDCTETDGTLADSLGEIAAEYLKCSYEGKRYWIETYKNGVLTERGAVYKTPQKGKTNWLTVLQSAKNYGCKMAFLMEQGYHTNKEAAALLGDNDFLKKLAAAKVKVIAKYYGLEPKASEDVEKYKKYVVQKGDTLTKIALKFGTTWEVLAKINNIENPNLIYVGQIILVPDSEGLEEEILQAGDEVIVNGNIYSNANGGNTVIKNNEKMYVTEILESGKYKYPISVAKTKDGIRQGWADKNTIKKV